MKNKKMKVFTRLMASFILFSTLIASCKKGDGDSIISLRSRKALVAGEWKIEDQEIRKNYNTSIVYNFGGSTSTSISSGSSNERFTNSSYNGTFSESSGTSNSGNYVKTGTVSDNTWIFEKDGTFTHKLNFTTRSNRTQTDQFGSVLTEQTTVYTISESGVWNFLGSVNPDTKNKEEMAVSVINVNNIISYTTNTSYNSPGFSSSSTSSSSSTETESYEPQSNVSFWKLSTLKNKEMVVEVVGKSSRNVMGNDMSQTYLDNYSSTMTLVQD